MTREEAIIELRLGPSINEDVSEEYNDAIDMAIEALSQPEQKVGRWIEREDAFGDTFYNCSACGEMWSTIDGNPWDNGMDYCPNCGAKMEGEQNDNG